MTHPRRLPPLNALRAFEAAARHLSITLAAEELGVTPAAVSQQIRQLEESVGYPLLRRQGRSMALTEAGRIIVPGLTDAFDRAAQSFDGLNVPAARPAVRVWATPSFAGRWLLPRLERFLGRAPGVDVHVSAGFLPADFARDAVDLSLGFPTGRTGGLVSERLSDDQIIPICSPRLLSAEVPAAAPADLARFPLLHDDTAADVGSVPDWRAWLAAAGAGHVPASPGLRFNSACLVIDAAIRGLGVALARRRLVAQDLAEGRLVRLFPSKTSLTAPHFLAATPEALRRKEVQAFRAWVIGELKRE